MTDRIQQILSLIDKSIQIVQEVEHLKYFSEEDTKVKLILPLFEILGWNPTNPQEVSMEVGFSDEKEGHESRIDCVLWNDNRPYIFIEAKRLNERLPNPEIDKKTKITFRIAQEKKVKFVVLTNFLTMKVYSSNFNRVGHYFDPSCYLIQIDELFLTLAKPKTKIPKRRKLPECFGTHEYYRKQCQICDGFSYFEHVSKHICLAISNLQKETNLIEQVNSSSELGKLINR